MHMLLVYVTTSIVGSNISVVSCKSSLIKLYSLRPQISGHLEILRQIMESSRKCIGKMQDTISLLFNYPTSNELSACRKKGDNVLNVIGLDSRAMREKHYYLLLSALGRYKYTLL